MPRIVDEIFGRPDGHRRRRWIAAVAIVAALYGAVFGLLPFIAVPSLQEWASRLAAQVHAELGREREIALEPPPPLTAPPPPTAPPAPAAPAPAAPAHARVRTAPATAAAVIARSPSSGPLDLTGTTFVTGTSANYAGGTTTSRGTSTQAVQGHLVPVAPRGRPVRLADAAWSCPWPREADGAEINEQVVLLRVAVQPDGKVSSVDVLSDPGSGFGGAARRCAERTRFSPAQDERGQAVPAWSPTIRVRFIR